MARTVTMHVAGLSELGRRMSTLKADVALKIARSATSAAATIVKKAAKRHLQTSPSIDSGLLEKNVIIKKLGKRDTNLTSEHIVTVKKVDYPEGGKKRNTKQVGIYLELGTVNMPAEPYLRPAFEESKQKALQAMVDRLRARITKAGA